MGAKIAKRERLMNLIALLLSAKEPVPFRDISGRVVGYDDGAGEDALEKRFDRDKADLRTLGLPLSYVPGEHGQGGGYVLRPGDVFQEKVSFSPPETLLLAIAGRVGAAATGGGALEEALKGALRKLAVDTGICDPLSRMAPVTVLRARSGDPDAQRNAALLSRAIARNRPVAFPYRGLRDESPADRTVDPYGLGLVRGAWYLVGRCHGKNALRVFRVSRIAGPVRESGPSGAFQVPLDFDMREHLGASVPGDAEAGPVTVRLAVKPGASVEFDGPAVRELAVRGGDRILDVEVRDVSALVRRVLSAAGAVTVLEPAEVRKAVLAEARRLADLHGGAGPRGARMEAAAAGNS